MVTYMLKRGAVTPVSPLPPHDRFHSSPEQWARLTYADRHRCLITVVSLIWSTVVDNVPQFCQDACGADVNRDEHECVCKQHAQSTRSTHVP
jgi:hypothetical protein